MECILEDDDIQCGHVVYNEISRVLKYICLYCQKSYDNIDYFCQHLTEHINNKAEEDPVDESESKYEDVDDPNSTCCEDEGHSLDYEETEGSIFSPGYMEDMPTMEHESHLDPSDIIIEEIADEVHAHLIQEDDGKSLEEWEDSVNLGDSTSCSQDRIRHDDGARETANNSSFEECFLKETNIEKIRSHGICILKETKTQTKPLQKKRLNKAQDLTRLRRKGKKVTTVKVIAVKNRVAELYDRIKNEQAKSQQILASNGFLAQGYSEESINMSHMEQETQDALESLPIDENLSGINSDTTSIDAETSKEVTRKIIGETLITLIPEGTKIPNTLPSPVEKLPNNVDVSPQKDDNLNPPSMKYTSNDKKAVCPACGKTFRSHFSLTIHKRIHYLETDSSIKLAHKCSDCDQLFNKLSQLKQHVESVHYPDGFVCKICNRKLSSLSLLERHMVKVHLDRPFNCQQCGKNFSDPVTYEEHIISHNSGEIYKCNICGRKYSTEFFLMEHMRNHKEQIPQTCVVCGKVTLRITQHMKIHTPRPKRLLSCSVCGKVFNFSSGLSHHFKIMHKLPRPPPKPKKEPNPNAQKRKRKPRSAEKAMTKKHNFNTSSDTSFNTSGQIIEEPSEVPDEIYNEDTHTISDMSPKPEPHSHQSEDGRHHLLHNHDEEDVNHKEEEAKRVIVELIKNSAYTSFFPDNLSSVLEVTPPIAREETISAVNSIVHDC